MEKGCRKTWTNNKGFQCSCGLIGGLCSDCKKEFNLSEKETKILVRKIQNQPDFKIVENKDHTKIIIDEPIEIEFDDGFFKEDVKEKIQNARRRLKERPAFEDIDEWTDKIFKEEFGEDLI